MNVFLLVHDRGQDEGLDIVGIYSTVDAARAKVLGEAGHVGYARHDWSSLRIEEWEVDVGFIRAYVIEKDGSLKEDW